MITKIRIRGYRIYKNFVLQPNPGLNILVGNNDAGKSTLMEAISLALNGRIGGRGVLEELNPHWFNTEVVADFLARRKAGERVALPQILIEIYLQDEAELAGLLGAVNADVPTTACPGVSLAIFPNEEYRDELDEWLKNPSELLPVEYYTYEWRSFADKELTKRPRSLSVATIDSRTVRSAAGVDYHLRQILSDHLDPPEKAATSENHVVSEHDGVFLVHTKHVREYVERFQPQCLRNTKASGKAFPMEFLNFKVSKGATFERVLIVPTAPIEAFIRSTTYLESTSAAAFYVAVTRAKQSLAIVIDKPGGSGLPVWRP